MANIPQLIKQYGKLMEEHRNYEQDWQDIAYYVIPTNRNIQTRYSPGTSITDRLYDAHAIHNNNLLAASMKGAMTNRATKWFSMVFEYEDLNQDHEVRKWLEQARDITLDYLADSNFYAETHQLYRDTSAFGTGCLYVDKMIDDKENFLGLVFKTFGLGDYCISEDEQGRVNTLFRKVPMTFVNMVQEFGEENVPEQVRKYWKDRPFEKREVVHCVYPNYYNEDITQPYISVHYDVKNKLQLREKGYWQMPYMVPRWDKITGEVYGYGPGNVVLPDIRNLNLAMELDFKAWAKTIDPPLEVVDDGSIVEIDLTPAAVNYVREIGRQIAPIKITPNLQHTQINVERLKESINRAFYTDQLQLHSGPQMTASEVIARTNEMNRILGPVLGRLTDELLDPLINRVFHILLKYGAIPEPPPQVEAKHKEKGVPGNQYRIRYESPLARAQRSNEMQAMQNMLAVLGPVAEQFPEVLDIVDPDKIARKIAETSGVSEEIMRTDREVQKIREQRAQQQAEMAKRQQMMEEIETVGKAAGGMETLKDMGMLPGGGGGGGGEEG